MHTVVSQAIMSSSKQSLSVSVLVVFVVVVSITEALSVAVPSPAVELPPPRHGPRPPTLNDRRRSRRRATVDEVRAIFGGIKDVDRLERLTELVDQDMVAALLEYNEMAWTTATGNGSEARTCWMRLNYNVTNSPGGLTELFRDQVYNPSPS